MRVGSKVLPLAVALVFAVCQQASASFFFDGLTFDNSVDVVEDGSFGKVTLSGTPGSQTGLIQGIINFNQAVPGANGGYFTNTGGSVFAAYSFAITEVAGSPGTFTSSAPAAANSALALISGADTTGLIDYGVSGGATPTIAVFETAGNYTQFNFRNTNTTAGSPLVAGDIEFGTDANSIGTTLAPLSLFDVVLTAGLIGDDFHDVTIISPTVPLGVFAGAYTVFADVKGTVKYDPIASLIKPAASGDIVIDDGSIAGPGSGANGGIVRGWNFSDGGNFLVDPVPEASTLVVWSCMTLCGLGLYRKVRSA